MGLASSAPSFNERVTRGPISRFGGVRYFRPATICYGEKAIVLLSYF
jgi:hypothetical protein